jgi:hypothetical protein
MLRTINNVTGAILGAALLSGVIWFRLSSTAQEMFFGYVARSTVANSPKANDALLIYPIIGMFIGAALVTITLFASHRRNKRRIAIGADTTDPAWIMVAAVVLPIIGATVFGHYFG